MKSVLTIGQLAKKTGVGIETLRFYEREGLIPEPPRSAAGYRHYSAESIRRVCFIRNAKELGFSLKEIRDLLSLRESPHSTCADVRARAEVKIGEIERKIAALNTINAALSKLIDQCGGNAPTPACPILEALDTEINL